MILLGVFRYMLQDKTAKIEISNNPFPTEQQHFHLTRKSSSNSVPVTIVVVVLIVTVFDCFLIFGLRVFF